MDSQAVVMQAFAASQVGLASRLPVSEQLESSPEAVGYAVEDLWLRIAQVCTVAVELRARTIELTAVGLSAALAAELYRYAVSPATYRWANGAGGGTLAAKLVSSDNGVCVRLASWSAASCEQEDVASWALNLGNRILRAQLPGRQSWLCAR